MKYTNVRAMLNHHRGMWISKRSLQSYINLSEDPDALRAEIRDMESHGYLARLKGSLYLTEAGSDELDRQFTIIHRRDAIKEAD